MGGTTNLKTDNCAGLEQGPTRIHHKTTITTVCPRAGLSLDGSAPLTISVTVRLHFKFTPAHVCALDLSASLLELHQRSTNHHPPKQSQAILDGPSASRSRSLHTHTHTTQTHARLFP